MFLFRPSCGDSPLISVSPSLHSYPAQLDIIVSSYKLEDQFEWDLENIDPTPEQFAEIYCTDLGLGGEFR